MTQSDAADQTVLITGGSGYLGGWCIVEALNRGYRVRTTVRNAARADEVRAKVASALKTTAAAVSTGSTTGTQADTTAPALDRLSFASADLLRDEGWDDAVAGCDYVLHVASPFPPTVPKDPDELIRPARDGTLRVLRAALRAGVKRVVVTSSTVAAELHGGPADELVTEEHWTKVDHPLARPYVRSKVLAERAAWDAMRDADAVDRLTVVGPGAILGPVLDRDVSYSLDTVRRLLNRDMPALPRLSFPLVDVRDVADLQLRAMTAPEAAGERFLATNGTLSLREVAHILRDRLGPAAARVPTRQLPDLVVRGVAVFDPRLRPVADMVGVHRTFSSEKARSVLGWSPRPLADTIVDCANSLIEHGVVTVPGSA